MPKPISDEEVRGYIERVREFRDAKKARKRGLAKQPDAPMTTYALSPLDLLEPNAIDYREVLKGAVAKLQERQNAVAPLEATAQAKYEEQLSLEIPEPPKKLPPIDQKAVDEAPDPRDYWARYY